MRTREVMEVLPRMRGEVVTAHANLERIIDGVLCAYYGDDQTIVESVSFSRAGALMFDMLSDDLFSFGLRCNVLEKILRREAWYNKQGKKGFNKQGNEGLEHVRTSGRLRNLFAHVHKGQGSAGKVHFFHPKGTGMFDFTELYDEFQKVNEVAHLFVEDIRKKYVAKYPDRRSLAYNWG